MDDHDAWQTPQLYQMTGMYVRIVIISRPESRLFDFYGKLKYGPRHAKLCLQAYAESWGLDQPA